MLDRKLHLLLALLCSALTMGGCRLDTDGQGKAIVQQTQLPKKVSQKTSPPPTPPKAPEKPADGSGSLSRLAAKSPCPDIAPAVYEALARPTVLPKGPPPIDGKRWIGGLEEQVDELRAHLRGQVDAYNSCRAPATQ